MAPMPARNYLPDFTGTTIAGTVQLTRPLGYGTTAVVYHGIDMSTGSEYAVKCMLKGRPGTVRGYAQRMEVLHHGIVSTSSGTTSGGNDGQLRGGDRPDIVQLHSTHDLRTLSGSYTFILLNYCGPYDLLTLSGSKHRLFFRNDALLKSVFIRIVKAVQHCHERAVYHRDIKPQNILVEWSGGEGGEAEEGKEGKGEGRVGRVWLADFGMATRKEWSTNFRVGTLPYISPECLASSGDPKPYSTPRSDVWSLGILLVNLISLRRPWRIAVADPSVTSTSPPSPHSTSPPPQSAPSSSSSPSPTSLPASPSPPPKRPQSTNPHSHPQLPKIEPDPCYTSFLTNPSFLTQTLPISQSANILLRRILNPIPEERPSLREIIDAVEGMGEDGREGFWMSDEEIWGSDGEDEDREDVRRAMSVFGYRVDGKEINADDNVDESENETGEVEAGEKDCAAKVDVSVASREVSVPKKKVGDAEVEVEAAAGNGASEVEPSSSHTVSSSSSGTVHSAASTPAASQGTCVGSVSADEGYHLGKCMEKEGGKKLVDVDVVEVKAEDVEGALPVLVNAMRAVAVAQVASDDGPEPSSLNADVGETAVPIPVPISCPS